SPSRRSCTTASPRSTTTADCRTCRSARASTSTPWGSPTAGRFRAVRREPRGRAGECRPIRRAPRRPLFFQAPPEGPPGGIPVMTLRHCVAAAIAAVAIAAPCAAQTPSDIAAYGGKDREQKLYEGAKKEGELTIYTSAQTDDMGALVSAFEKKYPGIKVSVWRSSSEKVLQRSLTEARGNRHTMDVAETNGPELESMHREKIVTAVKSPYLGDLIAPAKLPHGEWVGTRLNVFALAYNTNLVKKEELPKTWEDL